MKKMMYSLFALLMIMLSCDDDNGITVAPLANLTANSEIADDGSGTVNITASAQGAKSYSFDFGDGTTGTSLTGYIVKVYEMEGQNSYTVTITATGADGSTLTETLEVTVNVPIMESEFAGLITMLTNDDSKTWFLAAAQPGHLGVGPARDGIDGEWWVPKWYSAQAFEKCGSTDSDCFCDDELTFSVDGSGVISYTLDNKGQTFFNAAHKDVVGGTEADDFCYDFDTSGSKTVTVLPPTRYFP